MTFVDREEGYTAGKGHALKYLKVNFCYQSNSGLNSVIDDWINLE